MSIKTIISSAAEAAKTKISNASAELKKKFRIIAYGVSGVLLVETSATGFVLDIVLIAAAIAISYSAWKYLK